jgi:type IV secretory pathway VirB10-like protein
VAICHTPQDIPWTGPPLPSLISADLFATATSKKALEGEAKAKKLKEKGKDKEAKLKEKEREQEAKLKEKEREQEAKLKEKEREKEAKLKEKEREKEAKLKEKQKEKETAVVKTSKKDKDNGVKELAIEQSKVRLCKPSSLLCNVALMRHSMSKRKRKNRSRTIQK